MCGGGRDTTWGRPSPALGGGAEPRLQSEVGFRSSSTPALQTCLKTSEPQFLYLLGETGG